MYFELMSRPVWRIVSMQLSNGTRCEPSPRMQGVLPTRPSRHPFHCVRCTEPAPVRQSGRRSFPDDVQGQSRRRFQSARLSRQALHKARPPPWPKSRSHLALATNFGTRNRRVVFDKTTYCRGHKQEVANGSPGCRSHMFGKILEHRGKNARRTVRWGCHNPAAGRVFLIDCHRVSHQPFIGGILLRPVGAFRRWNIVDARLLTARPPGKMPSAAIPCCMQAFITCQI